MSFAADEFAHNMKLASGQQSQDYAPFVYGHIANYDPMTHRVRVVLPSVRDEDDVPVLTSWMPLGTSAAGANWGVQFAPVGGATIENPTQGELVIVQRIDRQVGVQAVASLVWNQVSKPPFTDLEGGELGIACAAGATIKLDKEGSVIINAAKDVTITASGNLAFQATAAVIKAASGTVHKLVTDAMQALFNTHTHPNNGQPPTQQMSSAQLTTVLEAE